MEQRTKVGEFPLARDKEEDLEGGRENKERQKTTTK